MSPYDCPARSKDFEIRQLRQKDIDFAYEMVRAEQWNVTKEDLSRMLEYEPMGCFLAEIEGAPAGHVFSIGYQRLGWIGLLIVQNQHRKRGIGESLMLKAKRYLQRVGAQRIKLDAVPEVSELYRKMGFANEYNSLRFQGYAGGAHQGKSQKVSHFQDGIIERIAEFDARYFGANRERVLRKLYEAFPDLCFVVTAKSEVAGYIMCRKAELGYNLGPWVCMPENKNDAVHLLTTCLKHIGIEEPVYVGVPERNQSAQRILRRFGFSQYSSAVRMSFGKPLQNEYPEGIFAIGGPMKG